MAGSDLHEDLWRRASRRNVHEVAPIIVQRFQSFSMNDGEKDRLQQLRIRIWLLFEDSHSSFCAHVLQLSIMALIVLSTSLMIAQSIPPCRYCVPGHDRDCTPPYRRVCHKRPSMANEPIAYFVLESVCIAAFTIEYALRLFASGAAIGTRRFLLSWMNAVDLAAILPFYAELPARVHALTIGAADEQSVDASFLRVVRLIRIARILKMTRSVHGFQVLLVTLRKSMVPLAMLVVFISLLSCLFSALATSVELGEWVEDPQTPTLGFWFRKDAQRTTFPDFVEGWYWCVQTLTSEGYGDIFPITVAGKVIAVLASLAGVLILALPITIIGSNFDEELYRSNRWLAFQRRSRVHRCRVASRDPTRTAAEAAAAAAKATSGRWQWLSWLFGKQRALVEADELTYDQAHNVHADLATLLDDHFAEIRAKTDTILRRHGDLLAQNLTYDVQAALKRAAREGALMKSKRICKISNRFSMAVRTQPAPMKANVQSDATLRESSVTEDSWAELLR